MTSVANLIANGAFLALGGCVRAGLGVVRHSIPSCSFRSGASCVCGELLISPESAIRHTQLRSKRQSLRFFRHLEESFQVCACCA